MLLKMRLWILTIAIGGIGFVAACAKPGAFAVSPEARERLFSEPKETLTKTTPLQPDTGPYSIYRLVDAKIAADMKTRQISARIRVESSAGTEIVDMLGDVREDKRATLVDLEPMDHNKQRLTAQAYCVDANCEQVILDVYFKVGAKALKQQFVTTPLSQPKRKPAPQAPPQAPEPATPGVPAPSNNEDVFDHGPAEGANPNDELSGENQMGEYVGAGRDDEMIEKLWDRPAKPEVPQTPPPTAPVAPSAEPAPTRQEPPQQPPVTPPPPSRPAPPTPKAPSPPSEPPVPAVPPPRPAPPTEPLIPIRPKPVPPEPVKPQAPAPTAARPSEPSTPIIPPPPPRPAPPAPPAPSHQPTEPPQGPQYDGARLTPANPEPDTKRAREFALAPLLDLTGGGRAVGSFTDGRIEKGEVVAKDGRGYHQVYPERDTLWATGMMASLIKRTSEKIASDYPGTIVMLGDISKRGGGSLGTHASHQSGLDADIPYVGNEGFQSVVDGRGRIKDSFDYARNWHFFRLVASQKVLQDGEEITVLNRIFVNPTVKRGLCEWAKQTGLLSNSLDAEIMRRIRPIEGHANHFHLRLRCSPHYPACRNQIDPDNNSGC
jgi:murein endopeptidase